MSHRHKVVGWREKVALPGWGVKGLVAKVDTGAKTSAVHVSDLRALPDGRVGFHVVLSRKRPERTVWVEAEVARKTSVRSSTGHTQDRYVVRTQLVLGGLEKDVELSLVERPHMLCRMLIGRTALAGDFLVDPSIVHLTRP